MQWRRDRKSREPTSPTSAKGGARGYGRDTVYQDPPCAGQDLSGASRHNFLLSSECCLSLQLLYSCKYIRWFKMISMMGVA